MEEVKPNNTISEPLAAPQIPQEAVAMDEETPQPMISENPVDKKEEKEEKVVEKKEELPTRVGEARLKIYPITNYKIITQPDTSKIKLQSSHHRMDVLREFVEKNHVSRVCVYGVILVNNMGFPCLLTLQPSKGSTATAESQLIGGKLKVGEDDPVEGLKRKMRDKLNLEYGIHYDIGELLGVFYRINYDKYLYPYIPPHVTLPKEIIKVYMIHMKESCKFGVLDSVSLNSLPLYDLLNNTDLFDVVLCNIPTLISRYILVNG
ncbi:Cleavage and polyadenylation specificity factor subunit, putative [Entamoeba invadens IP1]|uniref:Cleavage and polyadenylation specificity factor subunit 5 n=1 Tax=Entamoeba invadens IP1 TaxID=370355 RepID=A0A0A1UAV9_ENTIV|nr:Cleavage and polyadenylation specificity factor subunit, putative [Entamoeba invadens IP1]ELP92125.1 Cleavage and polyadenylation specificity factor subunit, putative [Entamoeba invadens IP1]|eukprot:XP_004258896.1 Cleavage and polyadenylation specificity factor subunit, putative [Entamoeba invadens IP1]